MQTIIQLLIIAASGLFLVSVLWLVVRERK